MTDREKAKRYDALMVGIKFTIKSIEKIAEYDLPQSPSTIQAFDYGRAVQAKQDIDAMRKWVEE